MRETDSASLGTTLCKLTDREAELLRHLDVYQRPADIARTLGISKETVRTHLKNIRRKLGNREPLAVAAELAIAEGRTPYPVTPSEGMPSSPEIGQPTIQRALTGLAEWLPVRQEGTQGNDLTIFQRCTWVGCFAVAIAVGFGMLAVGAETISRVLSGVLR